jgi:uncharacterized protein YndB with AHSA1/START domain
MATVDCVIAAPPAEVFAVLADGWSYSNWVVGTSHMRAVEANWPEQGSRLFHATGVWPVVLLRDESLVEQVETGHRLVLTVRGWPLGEARVTLDLVAEDDRTRVTMSETPTSGPGRWLHNPLNEAVLARRNTEALARLTAIAERRTSP